MRKWHAEVGRGPWGRGWLGLWPKTVPNVGGGRSFGWWQIHVWWTHNDGQVSPWPGPPPPDGMNPKAYEPPDQFDGQDVRCGYCDNPAHSGPCPPIHNDGSREGGSDRPCVPPRATDRERGSAPILSEHPCPQCLIDGHRDILDGWGYTRYLCPDHGKWVIFRWPAEQRSNEEGGSVGT